MKEMIMIICEKESVHFLVHKIEIKNAQIMGSFLQKLHRQFTGCLIKGNQTSQVVQAGESAKEIFME
jgi:hypothetical protein